jgi:hypothetical protein
MYPTPVRLPAIDAVADGPVVLEAAEIAARAVQAAAGAARLAAARCGCHACRTRAPQTLLWALAMQHRQSPADAAPVATPAERAA